MGSKLPKSSGTLCATHDEWSGCAVVGLWLMVANGGRPSRQRHAPADFAGEGRVRCLWPWADGGMRVRGRVFQSSASRA